MDIGRPKRIIEVEPETAPLPEILPEPAPADPSMPATPSPLEVPER